MFAKNLVMVEICTKLLNYYVKNLEVLEEKFSLQTLC